MSDGFDKEAEREKLREKFAKDDEKREHTQRMSELLLKGATMTNRHCDDCGDPIFRQDGQEFCPSCHTVDAAAVDGDPGAGAGAADAAGRSGVAAAEDSRTAADAAAEPRASGGAPDAEPRSQPDTRAAGSRPQSARADTVSGPDPADAGHNGDRRVPRNPSQRTSQESHGDAAPARPRGEAGGSASPDAPGSEGVADARESLARTLTRFARAAESTDDPRRAREHLRAAREAAETLAALD